MANNLKIEIVTPDRKVLSEEVEYVGAPGIMGEFGVLPNHVPFLSALGIGNLHYKQDGKAHYVFIAGGFAEVSNNQVTILAEVAEKATEIDVDRAQKAKQRAEERTAKAKEKVDAARNQASLKRAIARINARSCGKNAGTC
ncbi:ATP synthase epsilon chain [Pseudodesulfovibrio profundus]|uniref:ATP synthase epsilon chain n=1 Tax=Pseudodesulfovibrio profundus TaxID=57320 RepID=A0A2C8F6T2_9BACT|nr:F0F1 ATP synthase subunit epsilon [Pseudodesulfovibrio profundus]MBC17841.1 F0F1 ATP synthase subunit epsilon [Desulfovibrio sp.]SOB58455.1 ATP synthase epsilon chain [Pseudodesulfovibrio profundus]|tara:strand:+ start:718 stop:1140 length:423 start_codon:yes stop_codon:yes gene_type:complete